MNHFDAIVIGQGPGGAAAGFEMARRGLRVLAFAGPFQSKACGGCLSARWRYLFDFLEAPDWLWQHPVKHIILDALRANLRFPGAPSARRPFWWTATGWTDGCWINPARPGPWCLRQKPSKSKKTGQGFWIKAEGREYTADWLIGAEGALSLSKTAAQFCPAQPHLYGPGRRTPPCPAGIGPEAAGWRADRAERGAPAATAGSSPGAIPSTWAWAPGPGNTTNRVKDW